MVNGINLHALLLASCALLYELPRVLGAHFVLSTQFDQIRYRPIAGNINVDFLHSQRNASRSFKLANLPHTNGRRSREIVVPVRA